MGMLQTHMKKVPEGKTAAQFINEVNSRCRELYSIPGEEAPEGHRVELVEPALFDSRWEEQENLKRDPAVEAKYRDLCAKGQVIVVEIDW